METKKKLLIFMPFIGGGGVEKNLFIISNFLVTKLNKLTICTTTKSIKKKVSNKIDFLFTKKEFTKETNIRIKYLFCLYTLYKFLKKNKETVVLSFQANIYCIIICKILNIKIIIRSNSSPAGWYHNFIKRTIYKKIISFADEVVVNSLEFKKQMQRNFNIKVRCIFNPLNKKEIIKNSKKKTNYIFLRNKKNCLKILNIGRLTEQKDQITLLKAANQMKKNINFRILILGSGIEEKNLRAYISKNNLNNFVKIKSFTQNPYPFIKQADIFVLSSKYEGLPNVLLEAATLKKIIFSTNCPTGPNEILDKGKGGFLFKIGNYKDLVKKINFYLKNKKKSKLKIRTVYNGLKRYDYNKNLNEYFKLLKPYLI